MDGKKFYILKTSADKWHDATRDQQDFIMRNSSRVGFQGIRKIGFCHGSLVCPNPKFAKRVLNEASEHDLDVVGEDNNSLMLWQS